MYYKNKKNSDLQQVPKQDTSYFGDSPHKEQIIQPFDLVVI
jgi:hypothetical protein